jgi:uncharacterized protein (TIGR04255 family)
VFPPIQGLDAIAAGSYWRSCRERFPKKQVHPAIASTGPVRLALGIPPQRAWLISDDDVFLIQVQADRFYFNWRLRNQEYPRFGDYEGHSGIKTRMLAEYERFADFCRADLGALPQPSAVHLAKVDHLIQGTHWNSYSELVALVPVVGGLAQFAESDSPTVSLALEDQREGDELTVRLDQAVKAEQGREPTRMLKIEANAVRKCEPTSQSIGAALESANAELNDVFARLMPSEELRARAFGGHQGGN